MAKLLITHPRLIPDGPHYPILRDGGFDIVLPPDDCDPTEPSTLVELLNGVDAVIAGLEPFNAEVIGAHADHLRVVARCGVGYDTVDVQACDQHGIAVTITPGTNHHSVAEHALSMIFALSRGFPRRDLIVRGNQPWKKPPLPRLAGSTIGIVGLGRIGQSLAIRLPSLQVKTIAYDPYADESFAAEHNIELTSLDELWQRSDYISLHLPVTSETEDLICLESLRKMKPTASLVNTARGGLINEADLYTALSEGIIRSAGLDVFKVEPPPADHPLLQLDNVLFSPHAAGVDTEAHIASVTLVAEVLVDLLHGRWPADCIVNLKQVTRLEVLSEARR